MARVLFLGTPEYAVPALEALLTQHEVVAVVTQPDRATGRGRCQVCASPVKRVAEAHGVPIILQPERLRRDREALATLRNAGAEVFVLAAYGQILPQSVLDIPPHGCVGLHASLLPRWRGAAPIARAIQHGDAESGVTLMLTDAGVDTGPIIVQRRLGIALEDTAASLTDRLARLAAETLIDSLPDWLAGRIRPAPQPVEGSTYAAPVNPAEGALNWTLSASALDRLVRAMTPWPGAYTTFAGARLKVLRARADLDWRGVAAPGTVIAGRKGAAVATGEGLLVLEEVQLAGKRAMEAAQFCQGQRGFADCVLGADPAPERG
jgi:methionyl-tRNA formyltransferase